MPHDPIHDLSGNARLREIMRRLRDPENGCPWDIEQSFKTIAPYTIEEAYEVSDAIEREAWDELKSELDALKQMAAKNRPDGGAGGRVETRDACQRYQA